MAAAATGIVPAGHQSSQWWCYEIRPPGELPVLDLSLSLKSRFLSRPVLNRIDLLIQQRKLIGIMVLIAEVDFLVALLAPRDTGRVAAILTLIAGIPVTIAGFSSLRYDVVVLLVRTYDFWFLSCVNVSVFAVLGGLMGDLRALVLLATWAGVQMNIMVDANIRRVRSWLFFNIIGIAVYTVTWVLISFALIDHMHDFRLVHVSFHELPATSFATSGLGTIIAVFARNVFRRRNMLRRKQSRKAHIECASYRTDLQFYPAASTLTSRSRIIEAQVELECVKPMKYVQQIGLIDARNTLLSRSALERLKSNAAAFFDSPGHGRKTFSWLGILTLLLFIGLPVYSLTRVRSHASIEEASYVVVFVLTLVYCGTCALHYHRTLLFALVTSFDFVLLSAQVTAVHLSTCVFFNWSIDGTVTTLTSWIWAHWFLCLDALPPVMKRKLGITKGFATAVLLTLTSSSATLLYLLIFTEMGSSDMYDHVLLKVTLFGRNQVQIKLASVFFNCFATAAALTTRLIWRLVTLHSDVLLVLDGIVEYENYLVSAKVRASRRFGSLNPKTKQSQARPSVPTQATSAPDALGFVADR